MSNVPLTLCPFLHSVSPTKFPCSPGEKAVPFYYDSQIWNVFWRKMRRRYHVKLSSWINFSCREKACVISSAYLSSQISVPPNLFTHYFRSWATFSPSPVSSVLMYNWLTPKTEGNQREDWTFRSTGIPGRPYFNVLKTYFPKREKLSRRKIKKIIKKKSMKWKKGEEKVNGLYIDTL